MCEHGINSWQTCRQTVGNKLNLFLSLSTFLRTFFLFNSKLASDVQTFPGTSFHKVLCLPSSKRKNPENELGGLEVLSSDVSEFANFSFFV